MSDKTQQLGSPYHTNIDTRWWRFIAYYAWANRQPGAMRV
jgi:DUF1680 family protein